MDRDPDFEKLVYKTTFGSLDHLEVACSECSDEQHDSATSECLVVVMIRLCKLFSGKADLTNSHAVVLQTSSTIIKYLIRHQNPLVC